jgi:hypothetical protein
VHIIAPDSAEAQGMLAATGCLKRPRPLADWHQLLANAVAMKRAAPLPTEVSETAPAPDAKRQRQDDVAQPASLPLLGEVARFRFRTGNRNSGAGSIPAKKEAANRTL